MKAKPTPAALAASSPAPSTSEPDSTATPTTPSAAPPHEASAARWRAAIRNRIRLRKAREAKITATTAEAIRPSAA